jgi:hypothetical protein
MTLFDCVNIVLVISSVTMTVYVIQLIQHVIKYQHRYRKIYGKCRLSLAEISKINNKEHVLYIRTNIATMVTLLLLVISITMHFNINGN